MSGRKGGGGSASGRGGLHERVKTARRRTASSTRWLQRQLNDPYVRRAQAEGYRSRAAYKLIELDDKFGFLKKARANLSSIFIDAVLSNKTIICGSIIFFIDTPKAGSKNIRQIKRKMHTLKIPKNFLTPLGQTSCSLRFNL